MMTPYARYPSLADRVVIVTGGASGIGASMVMHFAEQDAKVAFLDIDIDGGNDLASALAERVRHSPLFLGCDLCDIGALQTAIERVRLHFGPASVLVNNAANDRRHDQEAVSVESFDMGIAVNLRHQFFAAQAVAPDMRALGGGSIINLRLDQLDDQGGRDAGLHDFEGRHSGIDAQPRARSRSARHPCKHAGAGLGDDRKTAPPVGRRGGHPAESKRINACRGGWNRRTSRGWRYSSPPTTAGCARPRTSSSTAVGPRTATRVSRRIYQRKPPFTSRTRASLRRERMPTSVSGAELLPHFRPTFSMSTPAAKHRRSRWLRPSGAGRKTVPESLRWRTTKSNIWRRSMESPRQR